MPGPIPYAQEITIAMHVSDLARSIDWYTNVLGFTMLYKVDEIGWAEFDSPVKGTQIGLSQVDNAKGSQSCVPTFAVTDIDAARKELESKDVRFDGDTLTIEGMVKLATFFDPDGNPFMLSQSLMQH